MDEINQFDFAVDSDILPGASLTVSSGGYTLIIQHRIYKNKLYYTETKLYNKLSFVDRKTVFLAEIK